MSFYFLLQRRFLYQKPQIQTMLIADMTQWKLWEKPIMTRCTNFTAILFFDNHIALAVSIVVSRCPSHRCEFQSTYVEKEIDFDFDILGSAPGIISVLWY